MPVLGGAELPYPGYILPDDAPLSDLIPPAAVRNDHVPEPPTPLQEHVGPMTPVEAAPFSAAVPLSAPPSVAEGGDVSMPPATGALGSGLGAEGSGASGSAGSSAAVPIVVDPPSAARPAVAGGDEPRKRIRLNAVTFEGVDMYRA